MPKKFFKVKFKPKTHTNPPQRIKNDDSFGIVFMLYRAYHSAIFAMATQ